MVWQDIVLFPGPHVDVEQEREARLAAQAKAGADWALGALVARYQPVVIRYLTRLTGDNARATTLAERIFVRMERRIRGPHGAQHLRLWLLRASTETGLDALRNPQRAQPPRLQSNSPRGLLAERAASSRTTQRLRESLSRITGGPGSTSRQARPLIWAEAEEPDSDYRPDVPPLVDEDLDRLDPREALRHKLVRAVLAELPYGDAQCLALHLVAGLNQSEVAEALGIRPSATRRRIVQGLQLFARRYEAALASLGISPDISFDEPVADEEVAPSHVGDRGEDVVMPRAASSSLPEIEEDMVVSAEMPVWPRPSQPESVDTPEASAQPQGASHSVITMDAEPEVDETETREPPIVTQPREDRAIPVAESAIVGPIIDAVPVAAADIFAPAITSYQEQDTQTLSYTVLVEQPRVVESSLPVETSVEAEPEPSYAAASDVDDEALPESHEQTSLAQSGDGNAVARVVPILSSEGAVTSPALAPATFVAQEPTPHVVNATEVVETAEETARLIPILSHEHEDGDMRSAL